MYMVRRAGLAALIALALAGCAGNQPFHRPLSRDMNTALQPIDVRIGVAQTELYPTYVLSNAAGSGAVACGAVPGLGVLLAAACGATMGALDAATNVKREKEALDLFSPLKAELGTISFDPMMNDAMAKALHSVPNMKFAGVAVNKQVSDQAYEEWYRGSTANAVMVSNVKYHLSTDFTVLIMSARNMVYPRSPASRTAAGQSADLPAQSAELLLLNKNAVYRRDIYYAARLPTQVASREEAVAAWKANGARLLRAGLQDGIAQLSRLVAEDLQRMQGVDPVVLAQVDGNNGAKVDLLAESPGGRLLRYPNGDLEFQASLVVAATPSPMATAPSKP